MEHVRREYYLWTDAFRYLARDGKRCVEHFGTDSSQEPYGDIDGEWMREVRRNLCQSDNWAQHQIDLLLTLLGTRHSSDRQ